MNYSKINRYKTQLIAGSFALAFLVAVASFFYGVKRNTAASQTSTLNETQVDLKIKGNRNSRIYHLKGCPNYDDIKTVNIIWFKTKEEAKSAGFRMAKNC